MLAGRGDETAIDWLAWDTERVRDLGAYKLSWFDAAWSS